MPLGGGFSVTLRRNGSHQPWGLRIVGGCDLDKPIIVVRSVPGSPADGVLFAGDVLLQIGDYDTRDIRHQDAQALFKNAGNQIKLVVHREKIARETPPLPQTFSAPVSRDGSVDPQLGLPRPQSALDGHHWEPPAAPCFLNPCLLETPRALGVRSPHQQELSDEKVAVTDQPYRTTPLVLPGAKVKKDLPPTESYLRHHPNPMFRQAPPHPLLPHDIAMKQKVVNKQFNSPIGLYSEQNIIDSINAQTGSSVPNSSPLPYGYTSTYNNPRLRQKKTVQYDPLKSETFRVLQDQELGDNVQEVTPVAPKVFAPKKISAPPVQKCTAQNAPQMNSIGHSADEIQQSHTFKRLMYMVQNEGVY